MYYFQTGGTFVSNLNEPNQQFVLSSAALGKQQALDYIQSPLYKRNLRREWRRSNYLGDKPSFDDLYNERLQRVQDANITPIRSHPAIAPFADYGYAGINFSTEGQGGKILNTSHINTQYDPSTLSQYPSGTPEQQYARIGLEEVIHGSHVPYSRYGSTGQIVGDNPSVGSFKNITPYALDVIRANTAKEFDPTVGKSTQKYWTRPTEVLSQLPQIREDYKIKGNIGPRDFKRIVNNPTGTGERILQAVTGKEDPYKALSDDKKLYRKTKKSLKALGTLADTDNNTMIPIAQKGMRVAKNLKESQIGLKNNKINSMYFPGANQMTMKGMKDPVAYFGITDGQITDQGVAFPGEDFSVNGQDTVEFRLKNKNMRKHLRMGNRVKAQNSLRTAGPELTIEQVARARNEGKLSFWEATKLFNSIRLGQPLDPMLVQKAGGAPNVSADTPFGTQGEQGQALDSSISVGPTPSIQQGITPLGPLSPEDAINYNTNNPAQLQTMQQPLPVQWDYQNPNIQTPANLVLPPQPQLNMNVVNNIAGQGIAAPNYEVLYPYLETLQQAYDARDPNYQYVVDELLQEAANIGLKPSDVTRYTKLPLTTSFDSGNSFAPGNLGPNETVIPEEGQVTTPQATTPKAKAKATPQTTQGQGPNLATTTAQPTTVQGQGTSTPTTQNPQSTQGTPLRNPFGGNRVFYNPQTGLYEKTGYGLSDYLSDSKAPQVVSTNQPLTKTGDVAKEIGMQKAQGKGKPFKQFLRGIQQRRQDVIDNLRDERSDRQSRRAENMLERANDLEKRGLQNAANKVREKAGTIQARSEQLKNIESLQRDTVAARESLKQANQEKRLARKAERIRDRNAAIRDREYESTVAGNAKLDYEQAKANFDRAQKEDRVRKRTDKKEFRQLAKLQKLQEKEANIQRYQEREGMAPVEQELNRRKKLKGGREMYQLGGPRNSFQATYQAENPIDFRYNNPEVMFQTPDLTKSTPVTNFGDRYRDVSPVFGGDPTFSLNYANQKIDLGTPKSVQGFSQNLNSNQTNASSTTNNNNPSLRADSLATQGVGSKWWRRPHNVMQLAGMAVPAVYNLGMSMAPARKVKPEFNKEMRKQLALMERRRPNTDYRRIDAANTAIDKALRNQMGNTSAINANRIAAYNKGLMNLGSMALQEADLANRYKMDAAQFATQVGADERAAVQRARQENEMAEATRQQFERAFTEQAGNLGIAAGQLAGNDLQNQMEWNMMQHIYQNYGPAAYEAVMSGEVSPGAFFKKGSGVTTIG